MASQRTGGLVRPWTSSSPLNARARNVELPIALANVVESKASSPSVVLSVDIQRRLLSSKRHDVRSVLKRGCIRISYSSATCDQGVSRPAAVSNSTAMMLAEPSMHFYLGVASHARIINKGPRRPSMEVYR
jgi:hypothetical protein